MINRLKQFFNIIKALPFLILAYIYLNIGYYFYKSSDSDSDKIRVKYTNLFYYYLFKTFKYGIRSQIIYLKNTKINLEKVTIINANHYVQDDIFILFDLLEQNNIEGKCMSSISTSHGIDDFDKKILQISNSAMVNNTIEDISNIKNQINFWKKRDYNTLMITFFEGITLKDSKEKSKKFKNLLDPKSLGFELCLKNIESKYIYDLNLVYSYNGKLLSATDFSTLYLFHPSTKIYVSVSKYELPDLKYAKEWLNELYLRKDKEIMDIQNKFNLSLY